MARYSMLLNDVWCDLAKSVGLDPNDVLSMNVHRRDNNTTIVSVEVIPTDGAVRDWADNLIRVSKVYELLPKEEDDETGEHSFIVHFKVADKPTFIKRGD